MMPKRDVKDIFLGDPAAAKVAAGASKMAEVVGTTYGPRGRNVVLGLPFGDSTLTRDGVTVAKRTILKDKAEDDAATILRQASEKTNKSAGDGTTATVVLGNYLFQRGNRLIAAGENGMTLKRQIVDDSLKVLEFLKSKSIDGNDHLREVATVSAGDPAIGALIADTMIEIGEQGGISIREQNYPTVDVEKVGGYLFDRGFFALTQTVEYSKPNIFVTSRQISSNAEMVPLLSKAVAGDNKNFVLVADVRSNSEAMNTFILNCMKGNLNGVIVPPPAFGDDGLPFLEDIARYVGAKLFLPGDNLKTIDESYFGTADRVQTSDKRCVIFDGAGAGEDIETRIAEIKAKIDEEKDSHAKDNLEQRYAKLTGKVAIVNVGGATPIEREELQYRVDDAIEACKSAMADGVLPGGGTMLVRALELDISNLYKDALRDTFRHLMNNAAEPADYRLEQVRRAEYGFGFNLRNMTDDPIDLRKAGIWDATRAVTQTVENGTSAAASLLTIGAIIDPIEEKADAQNTQS